jgi:hypothetical protein
MIVETSPVCMMSEPFIACPGMAEQLDNAIAAINELIIINFEMTLFFIISYPFLFYFSVKKDNNQIWRNCVETKDDY